MDKSLLIFIVGVLFFMAAALSIIILILRKSINSLGDYTNMEMIGKGGMSIIYRARNRILKRYAAVKVMDEAMMKDRSLVQKFLMEGYNLSQINKKFPDIPVVKVLEYSHPGSDSPYFIAMEYLEGQDMLKKMKSSQKPDLYTKLHVIKEVARALEAAHSLRIYHRDIAPDNIIVNGKTVTLIDFGVAKQEFSNHRTQNGETFGKPLYMSPEQWDGKEISGKSDIYSLGAVLYYFLAGKPMYDSSNYYAILRMHQESPIPEINQPLPGNLKDFLRRMLDKKPGNRPNAAEVVSTMENIMNTGELNQWE